MQFFLVTTLLATTAIVATSASRSPRVTDELCVGKANGERVPTNTCNSFVTCIGGVGILQTCGQGMLFSESLNKCELAENVECNETMGAAQGPAPNCQGRNGQMLRNPYDCTSFYFCEHNAALLFYCDAGLFFDTKINNCNWKDNVVCRIDVVPTDPDAPVSI